jgi:signal transduction histidine kinase
MRLLLVTRELGWTEPLQALFPADDVVPISAGELGQNPAIAAAAEACFVAEAQMSPWTVDTLKQLSAATPAPLFALLEGASQWEEAALFAGAEQVFRRPLRGPIVQLAVSRAQRRRLNEVPAGAAPVRTPPPRPDGAGISARLQNFRDASRLISLAHEPARLTAGYVTALRDILGASRAIVYGVDPAAPATLVCLAAAGMDAATLHAFRLNLRSGLAQLAVERGTVLWGKRLRSDSHRDAAALRELAVFGAELTVPIVGTGGTVGLLMLGPRVCGTEYQEDEVALIYQAAEALGGAIRRNDPDKDADKLDAHAVVQAMPVASAVVAGNLRVLDTNAAFRTLIGRSDLRQLSLEDLPPSWSEAIATAVQNGAGTVRAELEHRSIGTPRRVRLSIRKIDRVTGRESRHLVSVEDIVPAHEADLHGMGTLLQRAGEQLSNEFRNALTPVDIMVQLSHDTSTTRDELEQLSKQVSTAIHRLRRRIDDLAYLTKSAIIHEPTTVVEVLRSTRERLDEWVEAKHLKRVVWLNEFAQTTLMADARALAVALAELVINAIEACDGRQVTITAEDTTEAVAFRVRNFGVWAPPPESSGFRHHPFVSSKSTGVGLGIEVASRVAENHAGRLVLGPIGSDVVEAVLRIPRSHSEPRAAVVRAEAGAVKSAK